MIVNHIGTEDLIIKATKYMLTVNEIFLDCNFELHTFEETLIGNKIKILNDKIVSYLKFISKYVWT